MKSEDLNRAFADGNVEVGRAAAPRRRKNCVEPPPMLSVFAQNAVPVTIVCAPAGMGKTVALSELFYQAQAAGLKPTWVDGRRGGPCMDGLRLDGSREEATAGLGPLFVDDADKLDPGSIAFFVSQAIMKGTKLFLGARRAGGLRLARHLAAGDAQLLPPELLLWRRGALAAASDSKLTSGQLSAVERLTEGWAAPSMLLAAHLARGGDLDDLGVSLADSHTLNFIDEELLAEFPREGRDCLIALSLVDEFDGTLIDSFGAEAGLTIESLRSQLGPLIVPTGHAAGWRFNHLLRQHLKLLFARLNRRERHMLRDIVTNWAAARGDVVAAAMITVQAGEKEKFLDLVADAVGVTLWLTKGHHHLKKLVTIADDAGIQGDARFQLLRCASLLKEGRFAEADALYGQAMPTLPDTIEAKRDAAFLKVALLLYGCRTTAPEDAPEFRFLDSFASEEGWKTELPTIRAIHHSQHAEFDAAIGAILEATNHGIATGIDYNFMFLDMHRATIFLAQGNLAAARKALLRSRLAWRRDFRHDRGAETVMSALFAQLEFEAGKSRAAATHLGKSGSRILDSEAWLDIYVACLEPMFRLAAEQHGVAATVVAINRFRDQLSVRGLEPIANLLTALRIAIEGEEWLRTGERPQPSLIDATLPNIAEDAATWQEREFTTLASAYVDLASGEPDRAVARLSNFISYASDRKLRRSRLRALLLRAAALDRLADPAAASADFEEALRIGEETRMRRAFAEFGGRHTAQRIVHWPRTSSFIQGLGRNGRRAPSTTERSLTNRERQMLEALRDGKSDKAIGRDLGITEYGVRFHLRNLYAKLGVHDRAAAVSKGPC